MLRGPHASGIPSFESTLSLDFEPSTLWDVSTFQRSRQSWVDCALTGHDRPSVLTTTLLHALSAVRKSSGDFDALDALAACLRTQEAATLLLQHTDLVWPVSVFPKHHAYHCRRSLDEVPNSEWGKWALLDIEAPIITPPARSLETGQAEPAYRPLWPILYRMALHGRKERLLGEIGGTAAYRVLHRPETHGLVLSGAQGSSASRLRKEAASLRDIAGWPGMNPGRAVRLLNALYLSSNLMVLRSHPRARTEPARSASIAVPPSGKRLFWPGL